MVLRQMLQRMVILHIAFQHQKLEKYSSHTKIYTTVEREYM
nr:MAG TPA: hypothetical protein [Crassvirales sp.]